jgi:hypothetical protein
MYDENNFGSIDRLIEFGMSMAIAQQMVQTMNSAMQNMAVPAFKSTQVDMPRPTEFYALVNDIPQGPFAENQLREHITAGRITQSTMVWMCGMPNWLPAHMVTDVEKLFQFAPPPIAKKP